MKMHFCIPVPGAYLEMMNGKNSIFVIALWTLLLGPTLCGLGVMVHACFGDSATECHDEVQCSADPCQILVVPTSGQGIKPDAGMDQVDHGTPPTLVAAADLDLPALRSKRLSEWVVVLPVAENDSQILPLLC